MPDNETLPDLPEAASLVKKRTWLSPVWIIPFIAALLGGWIVVQKLLSEGPTIEISFQSAEGLEAGKTTVKYKGVDVGTVDALRVATDRQRIIARVRMAPETRDWLVEDTSFWVVRPRIAGGSITGLGTLLSGSYVGMAIGKDGARASSFTARDVPPVVSGNTPGRFFRLRAATLGSLDYGTPIYFRRIQVGQVASYSLDPDGRELTVRIFINAPYDRFVRPETRFWQASGLDFSLSANGLNVQTESLASLLIGGIAFDTPDPDQQAEPAAAETSFDLFADQAVAMKAPERGATHYVLYFDESVRGLSAGAPVTLLGLPIGEVVSVRLAADHRQKLQLRAHVLVATYPQRFLDVLADPQHVTGGKAVTPQIRKSVVDQLVARGMRAQLRTGNLLTGQLYVALDYAVNPASARIDWLAEPPAFPVMKGGLTDIEAKLTSILGKIERLPMDAIGSELKQSLATLGETLKNVDVLVKSWKGELTPELSATLGGARRSLAAAEGAFAAAGKTLAPGSATLEELRATLAEVKRAAQSMRGLTDYLERHPEALIRGKSEEGQ
ncbi:MULTISPECIES: intermembrane transport protein PqiB [Candidatus Accumulibacter]|mgnify:FL=1|uniref:Paraquat-inducible protein B n=1 Tax=Candidatus Accumulibacter phosphatis TaxID=327160 RepID=A0A5S4EJP8_9PROT|nr:MULTISPECIES: MlaD family protein [Candidatus Accumulibacter]MCM8581013.1 MlaD family protein [Accumulibacter sp.]TMQ75496.1 Paraquat-inducible protein B [Candidatus Accumulibacter phosphatis]HMW54426.1 MlaD family protein [Accumulibacter sp.]